MNFTLHENFMNMALIKSLDLCEILLSPNALFPWLILVPRVENAVELFDLSTEYQHQLLSEVATVATKMKQHFNADKMNIASFGNITSQLHIHVIARFNNDACFPDTTFGPDKPFEAYEVGAQEALIANLKNLF